MSKELVIIRGEIKTPPMSHEGRCEMGFLLRALQEGEILSLPHSRPMPIIGPRCHELRVKDASGEWRAIYRIDAGAILIVDVFHKKTKETPRKVIEDCRKRLRCFDEMTERGRK
jgi:phage-related protein